jgi:hypothetical protein
MTRRISMTERTAAKPAKKRISPAKPRRQRRGKPTHSQTSERAYFIHLEQRGCELENWLRAERELMAA